jgi:Tfp pilus assembly protein PilV
MTIKVNQDSSKGSTIAEVLIAMNIIAITISIFSTSSLGFLKTYRYQLQRSKQINMWHEAHSITISLLKKSTHDDNNWQLKMSDPAYSANSECHVIAGAMKGFKCNLAVIPNNLVPINLKKELSSINIILP